MVAAKSGQISGNTLKRVNLKSGSGAGADYGLSGDKPILIIQSEVQEKDSQIEGKSRE